MNRRNVRPPDTGVEAEYELPEGVIDGHAPTGLDRAYRMMTEAVAYRIDRVHFARDAGMTNQAIGEHLHLSEARVRQMLAAPEAVESADQQADLVDLSRVESAPHLSKQAGALAHSQPLKADK